ncbi:MAG TPA: glycosyltransferase family 2 protein [Anaerolineales bacterium]|nr:glycosyltransferase family 2 protein [Anaerolineales bacterium]
MSLPLPESLPDGSPWPRISIVTPSFNHGQYIEETIRSVLLQGYPNLEYIIVDGGSSDGTVEIIKKYEPWLTYWESEKDRGQSHAINKGWARATGDLIAYFNSDDFYMMGALEKVARAFWQDRTVSSIIGRINYINYSSKNIVTSAKPFLPSQNPCDLTLLDPDLWFLPQPASFWTRTVLEQVGMYVQENLHYTMDRELFYRTTKVAKVAILNEALASFRKHGHNKSIAQMLPMYKEDAIALNFLDDGVLRNRLRRWRVARWWRARGYYHFSSQSKERSVILRYMLLAAFYKPAYLWRTNFFRKLVRSFAMGFFV